MDVKRLVVGSYETNCYIVSCEGECALIDPGDEAEHIIEAVKETGCRLVCIMLTHGHMDHTGAVKALQAEFPGIKCYIGEKELLGINQYFPNLNGITPYKDGNIVRVGEKEFRVMETPGHCLGAVTLVTDGALFTGDTLYINRCGATESYGSSMDEMNKSLRKIAAREGDYDISPGHMELTTLDYVKAHNPSLRAAMGLEQA